MSRATIVTERILRALDDNPVYHQSLLCRTTADSSFGMVQIAMFIMPVEFNDLNSERTERKLLVELQEENIYVSFHKTRRQEGERLITTTRPFDPKHVNYTYGNLKGFTKLWLIEATGAKKFMEDRKREETPHILNGRK